MVNGVDRIDGHKLERAMKSMGFRADSERVNEMIKKLDEDEKGYVTLSEFLGLLNEAEVLFVHS